MHPESSPPGTIRGTALRRWQAAIIQANRHVVPGVARVARERAGRGRPDRLRRAIRVGRCSRGPPLPSRPIPGHRHGPAAVRLRVRHRPADRTGTDRDDVRLRDHARTTPPTSATPRPTSRSTWCAGSGSTPATTCTSCRTSPTSTTRCWSGRTRDGIDWRDLADTEIQLFREDMTALRVLPPERLHRRGRGDGRDRRGRAAARRVRRRLPGAPTPSTPTSTSTSRRAPKFGYESRYDQATMLALSAERGGDPDRPGKRHPLDPLLWRMARPGEPSWESPMGPGRPGWHIECAVIAGNRLGPTIDVQGGGTDLIFPHHECSAAHAEVLTGVSPFARHYTHAGMISLGGEKMSKSRGNLVFVSTLLADGVDPMRDPAGAAVGALPRGPRRGRRTCSSRAGDRLARWRGGRAPAGDDPSAVLGELRGRLADDLDTPGAVGVSTAGRRTGAGRRSGGGRRRRAARHRSARLTGRGARRTRGGARAVPGGEDRPMAYDEALAERVRAAVGERASYDELKMFGGLGLMVNTHMACGVMSVGRVGAGRPRGARRRHRPRGAGVRLHRPPDDRLRRRAARSCSGTTSCSTAGSASAWPFAQSRPPKPPEESRGRTKRRAHRIGACTQSWYSDLTLKVSVSASTAPSA